MTPLTKFLQKKKKILDAHKLWNRPQTVYAQTNGTDSSGRLRASQTQPNLHLVSLIKAWPRTTKETKLPSSEKQYACRMYILSYDTTSNRHACTRTHARARTHAHAHTHTSWQNTNAGKELSETVPCWQNTKLETVARSDFESNNTRQHALTELSYEHTLPDVFDKMVFASFWVTPSKEVSFTFKKQEKVLDTHSQEWGATVTFELVKAWSHYLLHWWRKRCRKGDRTPFTWYQINQRKNNKK